MVVVDDRQTALQQLTTKTGCASWCIDPQPWQIPVWDGGVCRVHLLQHGERVGVLLWRDACTQRGNDRLGRRFDAGRKPDRDGGKFLQHPDGAPNKRFAAECGGERGKVGEIGEWLWEEPAFDRGFNKRRDKRRDDPRLVAFRHRRKRTRSHGPDRTEPPPRPTAGLITSVATAWMRQLRIDFFRGLVARFTAVSYTGGPLIDRAGFTARCCFSRGATAAPC